MSKRAWLGIAVLAAGWIMQAADARAQEGAGAPAAVAAPAGGGAAMELDKAVAQGEAQQKSVGFWQIVSNSGAFGIAVWMALMVCMMAGIYFIMDSILITRVKRVMPQTLITAVSEAMQQGDVLKALAVCKSEPGPMANILTSGFSHVEEGFDVIQEAIAISADFESEMLTQRIQYLTLVAALAPMLGLLGTVQGMIYAFFSLAIMGSGAAQTGVLALNIGQALYTTAAGLSVTIPVMTAYHIIRNHANKTVLRMQAITMDMIKDLRNVEVVTE